MRRRNAWTLALWIPGVLAALGALLLLVLAAAGIWVERVYLQREIRIGGDGSDSAAAVVRAHGARFDWIRLNVEADSVWIRTPGLDARAGATAVGIDWIGGLLAFRPAARLETDSVYLRLRPVADTADTAAPLDSLAFPGFSIPLAARVTVGGLLAEDDSGMMARVRGLAIRNRDDRLARARAGRVETRWTGPLVFGAAASLDWNARDSVDLKAEIVRREGTSGARAGRNENPDRVILRARHAKKPLWQGRDSLAVDARSAEPYYRAFGIGENLPEWGEVRLRAAAVLGDSLAFSLRLDGMLAAGRATPDFAWGPQEIAIAADWRGDRGDATLRSDGAEGERVRLDLTGRLLRGADTAAPWWERAAATARGEARGLRVRVRDTLRTADAIIEKATWDGARLDAAVVTGDGSRVEAAGRFAGPPRARRGTFAADIVPDERWLRIFVGNHVDFDALRARGTYRSAGSAGDGDVVSATVAARGLRAYGATLDSVSTRQTYSTARGAYVLEDARLYAGDRAWKLTGSVTPPTKAARPARGGVAVDAVLTQERGAGRGGSLRYALAPDGTMEAFADGFTATALPHAVADSLPLRDLVLSGVFRWNPGRRDGRADLGARGTYADETVIASLEGAWDSRRLALNRAMVGYRGSGLAARARLRLDGKQFYEIASVPPASYERLAVEIGRIDLADLLGAFTAESPLAQGTVRGELAFSDTGGFAGALAMEDLALRDPPFGTAVRELRLGGRGDTLALFARTESAEFPLLNDTVRVLLTGARADTQHVRLSLVADDSLRATLEGVMHRFGDLRGTLKARGAARLPEGTGALENLDVDLSFAVPFSGDVPKNATLTTRNFRGAYAREGQPRQRFSLNPRWRDGTLTVSRLRIENDQNQALTGRLEYDPARGVVKARAEGGRFAIRWTDDYGVDLRDVDVAFDAGPSGTRVRARLSSGDVTFADPPLRVTGRLSAVEADFIRPPPPASGRRADRAADTLRLTGTLQESEIVHRLRSIGDIQRLLRRKERRPDASAPLVLDVNVRTQGARNTVNSDIVRLAWVGNLAVRGVHPYTLFEGRINTLSGTFGLERQAYSIERLDLKWLNAPVEEGEIRMEARKSLAASCSPQAASGDSCTVITRLDGTLDDMQFSYDSDCGGAFGAGANVAAILYSVQRGCYDPSLATGDGRGYGERALTLLEPTASRLLTDALGPLWGKWVETVEVTGLASLSREDAPADSLGEALSLALTSREYLRLRLKIRSGYHTASQDLSNPWEHMLAVEWRPPLPAALRDSLWRARLDNNLRAAASVQTRPVRRGNPETDAIERKLGLFYNHVFWGEWWAKEKKKEKMKDE